MIDFFLSFYLKDPEPALATAAAAYLEGEVDFKLEEVWYAMSCYGMVCYVMVYYVKLCYGMLCYTVLCDIMLYYVMLCCVMLC